VSINNPIVVVTGATQGLGFHLAKSFADAGASLAICGRNPVALEIAAREVGSRLRDGAGVLSSRVDVSQFRSVETFFGDIQNQFGVPDVVISNAGIYGPIGPLTTNHPEDWTYSLSVNLVGSMNVLKISAEQMIQRGSGRLIQISGGGATKAMPNFSSYAAAKAGLVRLVESLALELEGFEIPVNAVAPGALNTRLLDEVVAAGPDQAGKDFYQRSLDQVDSGGAGFEKATQLIKFLAFEASLKLTGKLISAIWDDWESLRNGGLSLTPDMWTLRRVEH
jgi:NAD(P)-dependent dehydrogenase (short-subunit alcohol dehydrogenase family)